MKTSTLIIPVLFFLLCGCADNPVRNAQSYKYFEQGNKLYNENKFDSAYAMYNAYVNNPYDSFSKAQAYRYMGDIQWYLGDPYGAQHNLSNAVNLLDTNNKDHYAELSYNNNDLGNISSDLGAYEDALSYYNEALKFAEGSAFRSEIFNGKAVMYQRMGNYNDAITTYDTSLKIEKPGTESYARIVHNRAHTKWLKDSTYNVLPDYWSILKLRLDSSYLNGLVISYSHLSDYYQSVNPDSALWYANKMLDQSLKNKSASDVNEAKFKIALLDKNQASQVAMIKDYKRVSDSLQYAKDTSINRFALIKNDVRKTGDELNRLKKHILIQRLMLYGLCTLAILVIAGISFWFGKRQSRIKQESIAAIRNAKLKTSQKVHDVVANGLYGIMNELEHGKTIDREPLIDKIEGLYEKSRNISYEDITAANDTDHDQQVYGLLTSFANEQTKVIIAGDQQTFWRKINPVQKQELELVLNELMVNMKKHSRAKKVTILFKAEDNKALVTYQDDGIGFPPGLQQGNGLKHTVNRINSLHGDVNFGKSELGGASIAISFPLQSSQT